MILRPRETLAEVYERALEEETLLQEIENPDLCPGCKRRVEPDYVICPNCQVQLKEPCRHCGRLIHPKWTICPYCAKTTLRGRAPDPHPITPRAEERERTQARS